MAERLPRKSSKKNIATWYQWVVKVARLVVGSAINNWNMRASKTNQSDQLSLPKILLTGGGTVISHRAILTVGRAAQYQPMTTV